MPAGCRCPRRADEIHRLAVTLNGMLDRLESARVRQRAFVADAAHELRSPLTNMRTELEVAQRLADRTDWTAVADDLLADTERLSRLVDDLLLLARADDADPGRPGRTGPVELGALLTEVAAALPVAAGAGRRRRRARSGRRRAATSCGRVLANLRRQRRTARARSRVVLGGRPGGGPAPAYHLVTVTDDGPGIPAADRERVFDRFTRLDDGRARDAGGAGLGLAIVRELVRRAGGSITLDRRAGAARTAGVPAAAGVAGRGRPGRADGRDGDVPPAGQRRLVQTCLERATVSVDQTTATVKQ